MVVDIRKFQTIFSLKEALARMIGVSYKRVVILEEVKLPDEEPNILPPYISIEIIDDASGELQELADLFAGTLISAIEKGELKQINDSDDESKVIFFRAQHNPFYFNSSYEGVEDEFINPKPYRFDFKRARFKASDIIAVCEKYSLYNDFFYPEQKPEPKTNTPADPAPEAAAQTDTDDSEDKPTNKALKRETDFSGLGEKKHDYTQHMGCLLKAPRQYDSYSLRWEYELEVTEIAKRMNIARQAVDELLAKAKNKVDNQ